MLMHQGIGLDAFNELPRARRCTPCYECCNSVVLASDLAAGRPYQSHDELFRRADALLFALSESSVDTILQAYPHIGRRPRSTKSRGEAVRGVGSATRGDGPTLDTAAQRYAERFGFGFVMFVGDTDAEGVLAAISDRLHHETETERKVVRNELAKINRTRLDRMLGPEGGYHNW